MTNPATEIFTQRESEVRSYCRNWPVVFDTAKGVHQTTEDGEVYTDFFSGAGALNYGHNNDVLKQALLDYVTRDGVTHSMDMHTKAKRDFLETFTEVILEPRGMTHKIQFPGPTGTNAVETALKTARKVTGRRLGILGLGQIGRAIAPLGVERGNVFGGVIRAHNERAHLAGDGILRGHAQARLGIAAVEIVQGILAYRTGDLVA